MKFAYDSIAAAAEMQASRPDARGVRGNRRPDENQPLPSGKSIGKAFAAAFTALALTACASQPRIVTKEVRIPVTTPCLTQSPEKPPYRADQVNLDGTIFDLVQALLIDREQRKSSELELRAALEACTK